MKAEWDDAPLRVRKAPSHLPMIFSLLVVTSVAAGGVYWAERTGKVDIGLTTAINELLNNEQPAPRQLEEQANQAQLANGEPKRSREELLEILQRDGSLTVSEEEYELAVSLLQSAQIYQQEQPDGNAPQIPVAQEEKQTVFNDSNYVPRHDVNSIRTPRTSQETNSKQKTKPYVSVVENSDNRGCLLGKPGSLECRRARRQIYDNYSGMCRRSNRNDEICQIAKNYEPTR
jgi:hypothetical protein